jgi:hypothetical protein
MDQHNGSAQGVTSDRSFTSAWFLTTACVLLTVLSFSVGGCTLWESLRPVLPLPPLDEQKAWIQKNQIRTQVLGRQAFLETWGKPTYEHYEWTQFFPLENGNYIPAFRVPLGEAPPGWDSGAVYGDALFFGYVDRGELLGFLDGRLVYRERLSAEEIHLLAKKWKKEELFKTGIERGTR